MGRVHRVFELGECVRIQAPACPRLAEDFLSRTRNTIFSPCTVGMMEIAQIVILPPTRTRIRPSRQPSFGDVQGWT